MRFKTIILTVFLASCANENGKSLEPSYKPTGRYLTSTWQKEARGGAAMSAAGYRHVLSTTKRYTVLTDTPASNFNVMSLTPAESVEVAKAANIISYSIYEMKSWERFCGIQNEKIKERDWKYINRVGRDNVPKELSGSCAQVAYSYQDYLDAWEVDCSETPPSDAQQIIRKGTEPPSGLCSNS